VETGTHLSQKTPLFEAHQQLGAKIVDFAGWLLPLWYPTGQTAEHMATRKACGLFDICHMGEVRITGRNAESFLSRMLTNRVDTMADGQAMYQFMLNEDGGVIDDCILYRFHRADYMLVVNAANIETDLRWLCGHAESFGVAVEDKSGRTAKLDLQGPKAPALLNQWIDASVLSGLKFFRFLPEARINGISVLVSRTGYTGEIGFELYTEAADARRLWDLLVAEGKPHGILPCGLAARDTLRVEAGLPLHGHELRPDRVALGHPWEFAIHSDGSFIGRDALVRAKALGIRKFVLPFVMEGKRKAMPGTEILFDGASIGTVLSAVIAPSMNNAAIGFLESERSLEKGTRLLFRLTGSETSLAGATGAVPFVPSTSRRKMEDFLP
jgi:aminomethyltransferase